MDLMSELERYGKKDKLKQELISQLSTDSRRTKTSGRITTSDRLNLAETRNYLGSCEITADRLDTYTEQI